MKMDKWIEKIVLSGCAVLILIGLMGMKNKDTNSNGDPLIFTSLPNLPAVAAQGGSVTYKYTIHNTLSAGGPMPISISINNLGDNQPSNVFRIDSSQPTSCKDTIDQNSSCDIFLVFSPEVGNVNRELVILYPMLQSPLKTLIRLDVSRQVAYVANADSNTNNISICTVNVDGSLNTPCNSYADPTFNQPVDVVLNHDSTLAYVANAGGYSNSISICQVNSADYTLSDCALFIDPDFSLVSTGLRLNKDNIPYATNYFKQSDSSTVAICSQLLSCSTTSSGQGGMDGVHGRVAFNSSGTLAYVTNFNSSTVSICDSSFDTCYNPFSDPNSTISNPLGMDINALGNYIYIGNSNSTVSICGISGNTLSTCSTTTNPTFHFGDGPAINLFIQNTNGYGYIPNPGYTTSCNNTISYCVINPDSTIGPCNISTDNTLSCPTSVWVATF